MDGYRVTTITNDLIILLHLRDDNIHVYNTYDDSHRAGRLKDLFSIKRRLR